MRGVVLIASLRHRYRRTGGDLPGSDPRPTHGAEMEGWFWRFTDVASGRVCLALCGINRHPEGDWATVAIAAHPGRFVRAVAADGAHASATEFSVEVPGVLEAGEGRLHVEVGGARLDASFPHTVAWPLRLGGGGLVSALPFLGQYWHPHVLGGPATGELVVDGDRRPLDGAQVYAEKNWGAGFPDRWWWGQAQGFADPSLCVAFGGGRLTAGPLGVDVTGCVLRTGEQVVRFAPPFTLVRADVARGRWRVVARRPGWRMLIDGDGTARVPHVLPVPLPAERRNVDRDFEHLAGSMRVQVWRRGRLVVDDSTELAALEVGAVDPEEAAALGHEFGALRAPAR